MRSLFLICILLSVINRSLVLPINITINKYFRTEENVEEERDEREEETPMKRCEFERCTSFVGSNLFDASRKNCFSIEDVQLLVARREFEMMIPNDLPLDLIDDKTVNDILRFFYYGTEILESMEDCSSRRIMEKAFYDTLGGFLRYYLVPVCKFSYYASKIELRTVRNVLFLYRKCRDFLNTNGNGWRLPVRNLLETLKSVKINAIGSPKNKASYYRDTACSDLDLSLTNNGTKSAYEFMIVSLPKIEMEENEGVLNNIWIPFSKRHAYNLKSYKSAFILPKFYDSVSRCYNINSMSQEAFDRNLREWFNENVKVHLDDDQFYPGLGGILNVYESTLNRGRNDDNNNDDNAYYNVLSNWPFSPDIKKRTSKNIFNKESSEAEVISESYGNIIPVNQSSYDLEMNADICITDLVKCKNKRKKTSKNRDREQSEISMNPTIKSGKTETKTIRKMNRTNKPETYQTHPKIHSQKKVEVEKESNLSPMNRNLRSFILIYKWFMFLNLFVLPLLLCFLLRQKCRYLKEIFGKYKNESTKISKSDRESTMFNKSENGDEMAKKYVETKEKEVQKKGKSGKMKRKEAKMKRKEAKKERKEAKKKENEAQKNEQEPAKKEKETANNEIEAAKNLKETAKKEKEIRKDEKETAKNENQTTKKQKDTKGPNIFVIKERCAERAREKQKSREEKAKKKAKDEANNKNQKLEKAKETDERARNNKDQNPTKLKLRSGSSFRTRSGARSKERKFYSYL